MDIFGPNRNPRVETIVVGSTELTEAELASLTAGGVFYSVADFGATSDATASQTRQAFEDAVAAASAAGGGVVYVPPRATAYSIAQKAWTDVASNRSCVRLLAKTNLFVPAGAELKMADSQISGSTGAHVVMIGGADCGVIGTGTINGNAAGQSGYSAGYAQSGPAGVFLPSGFASHRARIGAGESGYLRIQNCFGNAVNGGGTALAPYTDISIVGVMSDNVGEGPQLERCTRVEMRRIRSFNTAAVMVGDGVELSACQEFAVADIYADTTSGSGFDLFGCQRGTMRDVRTRNCNIDIHDFTPVDPCEDIDASGLDVLFTSGGDGGVGINIVSTHTTKAPKRLKVQGTVRNTGSLNIGYLVTQAADVGDYGGGPYDIDVRVEGVDNNGVGIGRAPRLHLSGLIDDAGEFGLNIDETAGADENGEWFLDRLTIRNSGTQDIRCENAITPIGRAIGCKFVAAPPKTIVPYSHDPDFLVSAADTITAMYGVERVRFTGSTLALINRSQDGAVVQFYFTVSCTVVHDHINGNATNTAIWLNAEGNASLGAGDGLRLMFSAADEYWYEVG